MSDHAGSRRDPPVPETPHDAAGKTIGGLGLAALRDMLARSLDVSPLGMMLWEWEDGRARILDWNPAAEAIFGWTRDEMLGRDHFALLMPHRAPGAMARLGASVASGEIGGREGVRCVRRDGEPVTVNWFAFGSGDTLTGPSIVLSLAEDVTEQEAMRRELVAARQYSENLIDSANALIASLDCNGRITLFNTTAEVLTGFSREDVIGKDWFDTMLDPADSRSARTAFLAWRNGHDRRILDAPRDCRMRTASGEPLVVSVSRSEIVEGGAIIGVLVFGVDVTEREAAIQALRESEAGYRLLFDSNPNPMWIYDTETFEFLEVNGAAVLHYGYSDEEFAQMRATDIRPPEDVQAFMEAVRADRRGLSTPHMWRHVKKDGSVIDVEISAYKLTWRGRPAELVLAHDRTEREEALAALRESEARYRVLFESVSDALYMLDEHGLVVEVNRGACDQLGYSPAELRGMRVTDFATAESMTRFQGHMEDLRGIGHIVFETEHVRRDGSLVPVEVNATAVEYEGRLVILGIARDIAERKRAEEDERLYRERLEAEVEARTAKLLELSRRLEETASARSELVERVNRAVRAEVDCIVGAADALLASAGSELPDEFRGRLDEVDACARRLLELVSEDDGDE